MSIGGVYASTPLEGGRSRRWYIERESDGWSWGAGAYGEITYGTAATEAEAQSMAIDEANRLADKGRRYQRLVVEGFGRPTP